VDSSEIVRAWKDPSFRRSLTPEQRAALPDLPVGTLRLQQGEPDPYLPRPRTTEPGCSFDICPADGEWVPHTNPTWACPG
jgi:mersacidin/lichenicidin family type 2 lantibiotic